MFPIRSVVLFALLAAAFFVVPAATSAPSSPYRAGGTFLIGSTQGPDACVNPDVQGQTSTCVAVTQNGRGASYSLTANGVGRIVGLTACFYKADLTPIVCHKEEYRVDPADPLHQTGWLVGVIPADAARLAVKADFGVKVAWNLNTL